MLLFSLLLLGVSCTLAVPIKTAQTTTNTLKAGDKTYFLPDNVVIPDSYKIAINVTTEKKTLNTENFNGVVEIKAIVNENIKSITLHASQMTFEDKNIAVTIDNNNNKNSFNYSTVDKEKEFLILNLQEEIQKGTQITITFSSYVGTFQKDMHGFYISQYTENNNNKTEQKTVLTTQFQPTSARKVFPCFDEPRYKATFELSFTKPKNYKVISNTLSTVPNHGLDLEVISFPATPKMSSYLVAFIVHEFQNSSSPKDDTFNVWSRPAAKDQTKVASNNVVNIVSEMEKFTGIKYKNNQIDKMDMAALPDFSAGAMENWGLLTYRETALLVDDAVSTKRNIQRVMSVISHEVAHQWFGNLITTFWWNNTWLNEGFATYFEYHVTGNVTDGWQMKEQFVVEEQQAVFGVDALVKTTPLARPVFTPSEINSHFGSISYNKGGSVLRMMENFLGSEIFRKSLQLYLLENEHGNTVPDNLWSVVQKVLDTEDKNSPEFAIKNIMSTWVLQAGYPVVNVNYNSEHVTFSQKRFFINPDENKEKASEEKWYVPISYTTSKEADFNNLKPKLWLTPTHPEQIIKPDKFDYIVVNIQESAYYRVNYDDYLWGQLAKELKKDDSKIHEINKAQMIDDALNLARSGLLKYNIAFDITDYLAKEDKYFPWYSAFQSFRYLLQRYPDNDNTGKELRMYLLDLMKTLIKDKAFDDVKNETQIQTYNRIAALEWACNLGHEECVSNAKKLFEGNKTETISKEVRSIVYCTALRHGTSKDWEYLWNKFQESNVAAEKITIINALGCSNDETTLSNFLKKTIEANSPIRKQDAIYVFSSVYTGTEVGVNVAFNFLKESHNKIIENYNGLNDLEKAVLGLGQRMTNETKINEFKELLKNENFANFRDAATETVDENVAWAKDNTKTIGEVLNKKRNPGSDDNNGGDNKDDDDSSGTNIAVNLYTLFVLSFVTIYFSVFN